MSEKKRLIIWLSSFPQRNLSPDRQWSSVYANWQTLLTPTTFLDSTYAERAIEIKEGNKKHDGNCRESLGSSKEKSI